MLVCVFAREMILTVGHAVVVLVSTPHRVFAQVREVRGMLAPFVLRRLKSGVLKQLVAKTEELDKVPLSKVRRWISFLRIDGVSVAGSA